MAMDGYGGLWIQDYGWLPRALSLALQALAKGPFAALALQALAS